MLSIGVQQAQQFGIEPAFQLQSESFVGKQAQGRY